MIEQRRLTSEEINRLIEEAPETETRNLKKTLYSFGMTAYEFFDNFGKKHFGLLSDGRPIYMAVLTIGDNYTKEFWTVVNSDVKEMFSLCKYCKRELRKWVKEFGDIYATMEKYTPKNQTWVEWLNFKKVSETDNQITYCIKGD